MSMTDFSAIRQARTLLALPTEKLLDQANSLREEAFGKRIVLCAIINARSGNCGMNCAFCAQSSHNHTPITTFPLLPREVLKERILTLTKLPVHHIGIVTSGAALQDDELEILTSLFAASCSLIFSVLVAHILQWAASPWLEAGERACQLESMHLALLYVGSLCISCVCGFAASFSLFSLQPAEVLRRDS